MVWSLVTSHLLFVFLFYSLVCCYVMIFGSICKTVCPMLSDHCLSCLSVCNVSVLWPNGCMDEDATWCG